MELRTFVKLNSITNLTDARYGAGMYVNLLGFDLDKESANYISPELFREITGWVSGVDFVGEFNHKSDPGLLEILKEYPSITWIEHDSIAELKTLVGSGYSLIYKIPLEQIIHLETDVAARLSESGIILHVFSEGKTLSENDLKQLKKLAENCKVLLGTGITEANILNLIDQTGIYGISLSGGDEPKPGLKDLNELADILEKLEIEE